MAQQPSTLPRWANSPPVAPPTTNVEPSEPEKDVGFQPGTQAQIVNITFAGDADGTYNVPINGVAHSHASVAQTLTQLIDSIAALINGGSQAPYVTASNVAGTTLRIISDIAGQAFTYQALSTLGASAMTATLATANKSNKPIRQFLNWLFSTIYFWLAWLFQSVFMFSDFGPDQALPQGDLPGTGAGLGPVAAADFSARVYASGFGVGLIASPQHTYADDADTYWDLGPDGVWDAVEVSTGAGAPAISAGHTRVFMVATVAGARTAVTDFRRTRILFTTPLDLQTVRYGDNRRGSLAQRAEERRITRFATGGGAGYTHVESFIDDANTPGVGVHVYVRHATRRLCFVRGGTWDGTQWVRVAGGILVAERYELGGGTTSRLINLPGATWPDSDWDTTPSASGSTSWMASFQGTVEGGGGITASNWPRLMVPSFLTADPIANPRAIGHAGGAWRKYLLGSGGTPLGTAAHYGSDDAVNAYLDPDTGLWTRLHTGSHSYLVQQATLGVRIFRRASSASDTWNDTINATTGWTEIMTVADEVTINAEVNINDHDVDLVNAPLNSDSPIFTTDAIAGGTVGATTSMQTPHITVLSPMPTVGAVPNSLYGPLVGKAMGFIQIITGAILVDALQSNYSAAFSGTDLLITLDTPLASPPVCPGVIVSTHAVVPTVKHLWSISAVGGTAYNTIRIQAWNGDGTVHLDMANVAHTSAFSFVVFGNQ